MRFILIVALILGGWLIEAAQAQDILRGTLKTLDVPGKRVVVTIEGKDREFTLNSETQVLGETGNDLTEKLKNFKAGDSIFVRPVERDGKQVLTGIRQAGGGGQPNDRPREGGGGGPQRATLKKVDTKSLVVTLTVDGKDVELQANDRTQLRGVEGTSVADRLGKFTVGGPVMFLTTRQDGRDVLGGMMSAADRGPNNANNAGNPGGSNSPNSGRTTSPEHSAIKPLNELGKGEYRGFVGGFYPNGENSRPTAHEAAGLKIAGQVRPLNERGQPDPNGKIVLLSVGMSNTSQSSQGFQGWLRQAEGLNPLMQFVNGAQGGMTAAAIQDPMDGRTGTRYWEEVDRRLQMAGVSREQVQAVWIKQADGGPQGGFPRYAQNLQAELKRIVQVLHDRFPNVKLCYLSSRTYGGFATTNLNPEPYAYESGFAVKWLIEEQLKGDAALNYDSSKGAVKAPWLSWGPYLWANGATKRTDGFSYERGDFIDDGTHQSFDGQRKVGKLMIDFFRSDSTTKSWFLK